jgi:imidazolonepropionase-like amidohydrolase
MKKIYILISIISINTIAADYEPYESSYEPLPYTNTIFKNANIYDGDGKEFIDTDIIIQDGKIIAIGKDLPVSNDLIAVDATGKWITPGIIDIHSHMGVYPAPSVKTSSDGNEATSPVTAEVWAEHSIWTQDPQFALALKGGVTTFHVLPGSANLIGGEVLLQRTFKEIQ